MVLLHLHAAQQPQSSVIDFTYHYQELKSRCNDKIREFNKFNLRTSLKYKILI